MSQQGTLPAPASQAGFITFLRTVVGISTDELPDDSAVIGYAYGSAYNTVNPYLNCTNHGFAFTYAVYNLGTHLVMQYAPDLPGAEIYKNNLPYFAYMRSSFAMDSFVAGVVNSSSDVSTSQSLTVPEAFNTLTISDLGLLNTPWGRAYLGFAQKFGPLWGLS